MHVPPLRGPIRGVGICRVNALPYIYLSGEYGYDAASNSPHRPMQISCAKSVACGFVTRSKLIPVIASVIQLSYLKLKVTNELAVNTVQSK